MRKIQNTANFKGHIFLDQMPGRSEPLTSFLDLMKTNRVDVVVRLTGSDEIKLKSPGYHAFRAEDELPVDEIKFPIEDYGIPGDQDAYLDLVRTICDLLIGGRNVLIHCAGGIGRTGTLAICVLLAGGYQVEQAVAIVKQAGSGPENENQKNFLRAVASQISRVTWCT